MACTIRIAAEHASSASPSQARRDPGVGGTQRLPRLVGKGRALQLILSGETIGAQEAYRIGLVDEVVPAAELIARAEAILERIAANAPLAIRFAIEAVNKGSRRASRRSRARGLAVRAVRATEDKQGRHVAFLEKRVPSSKGDESTPLSRIGGQTWQRRTMFLRPEGGRPSRALSPVPRRRDPVRFGADVIKVEPPLGDLWRWRTDPPQPQAKVPIPGTSAIATSAAVTLDLKSQALPVLRSSSNGPTCSFVNTPHPARKN
jgi:hypothetical protein